MTSMEDYMILYLLIYYGNRLYRSGRTADNELAFQSTILDSYDGPVGN
jgi:hypothetical protein